LASRLNMLFKDRRAHAYTRHLMEIKARMSREASVRVTDASDLVHGEVMSLCTTVLGTGDSPTGTGDSFAGTGYHITGTAGTRWRSHTARATKGGWADYGFVATVDREIMLDPEREVGYGITDSCDEIVETLQGAPVGTDMELGGYVREFETRVRHDMDEIYTRLDDEQTER
nr:hypothetical protein [Tanacetum cinerariifolium]